MLKVPPMNLNKQSQDATIQLIRDVLQSGIQLSDVSVSPLHRSTRVSVYHLGVRRCARKHDVLRGVPILRLPRH